MSETNGFRMAIEAKSNGVSEYAADDGKIYRSVIVVPPGQVQGFKISLAKDADLKLFEEGETFKIAVRPKFYNGRLNGFVQI